MYCFCLVLFNCGGFFEVSQNYTVNEFLSYICSVNNIETVSWLKVHILCFTNLITQIISPWFLYSCWLWCILLSSASPFLLAYFSPETVQWPLIKTRRTNKGTSDLKSHLLLMLTAAQLLELLLKTSAHGKPAENWSSGSLSYPSLQAELAGFAFFLHSLPPTDY